MKSKIIVILLILLSIKAIGQPKKTDLALIPMPNLIKYHPGNFVLNPKTTIYVEGKTAEVATFLITYIKTHKKYLNVIPLTKGSVSKGQKNSIVIQESKSGEMPTEAYKINVKPDQITLSGNGPGLLYGINTLLQLLPDAQSLGYKIPCLDIDDQPRFGYRGLMLDVARHFYSVENVKNLLDLMAFYKLNTFHWHLVDDQGWRIEIKKYPKLTNVGAFRSDLFLSFNRDQLDGNTYGGFYTQDEIRDVVKYAAQRHITIVPEIEMPGHSFAALRAYPEFKVQMPQDSKDPNAYHYLYNPSPETFRFLENVLTEVAALFPGKYIHIGGDEAYLLPWEESKFTQDLIKEKNLKDLHGLQSYFIQRIEQFLNTKGKSIIGWDEILDGGLAPNATVMSWRGEEGGISSAREKHNVIMTPSTNGLYFDYSHSGSAQEPVNIGYNSPLRKTYAYDPVPSVLSPEERKYIIGVQANLWTEFIATPARVQYMLFPRMFALSEIAWTNPMLKDFDRFTRIAVPTHLNAFERKGINFRVPDAVEPVDTVMIGDRFTITLNPPLPGSKIFYTINGRIPTEVDMEYTGPITFQVPLNESRELRSVVITAGGKRSIASKTVMYNRPYSAAAKVANVESGLNYKLVKGAFKEAKQLDTAKVVANGVVTDFSLAKLKRQDDEPFGVVYEGFVKAEEAGTYTFTLTSDDGSILFIDDELVVNNDFEHGSIQKSGMIPLAKGLHKIKLKYFDLGGASVLRLSMRRNNQTENTRTSQLLFHSKEE
ncbi:family 20 glycosylhydrolase [Pedobacter nyackensis]|uniref:family 20 glycosylhydrolase n=1 Tax=Pedobacter nyackensis TaxID=475255 RepID=UPI0029304C87|nr:family 20 glycosylhydrolase [Pedobacter nyackensis]